MILFELFNSENHPVYQSLEISNGERQYYFLNSIVQIAIESGKLFLSQQLIKAFNFHAITCLHTNAGEYRPCPVEVGQHTPPQHYRIPALMDDFVNEVNRNWEKTDPVVLATFVLWRLNNIHPFINGNGRTARAASYFVLCAKTGGWLPGDVILPELIRRNRDEYVNALQIGHDTFNAGRPDLTVLHELIVKLLNEQFATVQPAAANTLTTAATSSDQAPN